MDSSANGEQSPDNDDTRRLFEDEGEGGEGDEDEDENDKDDNEDDN